MTSRTTVAARRRRRGETRSSRRMNGAEGDFTAPSPVASPRDTSTPWEASKGSRRERSRRCARGRAREEGGRAVGG